MNKLISIIIPVYNLENYLENCLDSILEQDYSNYEVIIIDDASNDGTSCICKNFVSIDSRFKYFKQAKSGVSRARNYGIRQSKGEYIVFIDGDDIIAQNHLSNLLNYSENDIVFTGYKIEETNKKLKYNIQFSLNGNFRYSENLILQISTSGLFGSTWNKLFKKEIISKYNIFFNPNFSFREDLIFTFDYIKHCKTIGISTACTYYYQLRERSLIHSRVQFYSYKCMINELTVRVSQFTDTNLVDYYKPVITTDINQSIISLFKEIKDKKIQADYLNYVKNNPLYCPIGRLRRKDLLFTKLVKHIPLQILINILKYGIKLV